LLKSRVAADELFYEGTRALADTPFDCLQEEVVAFGE
jgi:hypothetical protein